MNNIRFNSEDELKEWLKDAWPVGSLMSEYDESGNYWDETVLKKDDKYYVLSYLDGTPTPVRPKKRTDADWYELREVKKITRTEIVEDWEFI